MSKVNLLPWRKNIQDVQNRILLFFTGSSALCAVFIIILISYILDYQVAVQQMNISYIDKEMSGIRAKIGQIKGLQENKKKLLDRMKVIRSLQLDKISTVQLLDLIPRVLPDSIYLSEIKRQDMEESSNNNPGATPSSAPPQPINNNPIIGRESSENQLKKEAVVTKKQYSVELSGITLSNIGVSDLLKRLNSVEWVSEVKLNQVQANKENVSESSGLEFTLQFIQSLSDKDS